MPTKESESLVLLSKQNGVVVIPAATPLTRLNYFDGKFLRASALKAEQNYLRQLVAQSNQAGGAGVAHGFDLTLGNSDTIDIGQGLAIDPTGRVLLLPQEISVNVQELIDKSHDLQKLFGTATMVRAGSFEVCETATSSPPVATLASNLYLIVISPAEALCGEEDVYGKLCEEACATSTDRPFVVEGLVIRAIPLMLQTPLPSPKVVALTQAHLRSRVASAYYEDERRRVGSLISRFGLEQKTWCLGVDAAGGSGVPIGVLARAGATTLFLDPWIARRERIDPETRRYWQWRMMMRPWDVFLAQILQFQCQLRDFFRKGRTPGGETDPCAGAQGALREAADTITELRQFYESTAQRFTTLNVNLEEAITFKGGVSRLTALNDKLISVGQGLAALPKDRFLINGGIIELPSAGYLPVLPGVAATINQQMRQLLGEGVDLRFCVVRPDYVAHALEEAQHLERISLLQGLDDPKNKPEVDILVPNGEVLEQKLLSPGNGFEASVDLNQSLISNPALSNQVALERNVQTVNFRGAARAEKLTTGGGAFYLSGEHRVNLFTQAIDLTQPIDNEALRGTGESFKTVTDRSFNAAVIEKGAFLQPRLGLWVSLRCDSNIFTLRRGDNTNFNARAIIANANNKIPLFDLELNGVIDITQGVSTNATVQSVTGHIDNARLSYRGELFANGGMRTNVLVDLNVTATLTGSSAIKVSLDRDGDLRKYVLTADWGKDPLEVSAAIIQQFVSPQIRQLLFSWAHVDLRENEDVLSAKNARHVQALSALELIGKILNDTDFADAKARLLFPPPPKPTDELIVRGTMDWVLFHRRRTRRCSQEVCVPAVAPPRQYQVYHFALRNLEELEAVRKKLIENKLPEDLLNKLPFVDFAGGVATLLTNPQAWRADWANIQPGNSVVYAGIANRESAAADGDTLALTRLGRLVDVLAPVSTPNARMQTELLNQVPSTISSTVDGVIFLFTIKAADLILTKTASPTAVEPGAQINYTLTLTNTGPEAAQNVTLTDILPVNATFVSAQVLSGSGWTVTPPLGGAGNVVFSKASVAANETATFQVVMTAKSATTGTGAPIVNTATVASATGDPIIANNTATTTTPFVQPQTADLSITKTVAPLQHTQGTNLTYTLTLTNNGPGPTQNVVVTDALPPSTTFVGLSSPSGWTVTQPAAGGTGSVSFRKASVAVGETATFQIIVRVTSTPIAPAPGVINNTVRLDSNTTDPVQATATSTIQQPVSADLQITKTANASTITTGSNITYTIRLTNAGTVEARDVRVIDDLPSKDFFVSARMVSGSGWNPVLPPVGAPGGAVIFSKSSVAAGEVSSFEIVIREHGAVGPLDNRVRVESVTNDPNAANNTAVATVNLVQPTVTRRALVVFASLDGRQHFLDPNSPQARINFTNNVPDGTKLDDVLKAANIRGSVSGVTLASIGPTEPTMPDRLSVVVDAVSRASGPIGPRLNLVVEQLSTRDATNLQQNRIDLTGIDEVIFIELVIPG